MSLDPDPSHLPERPARRDGWNGPLAAHVRPWVEWFGLGRLVAAAVTVVAVVVGGWWLLRTPAPPTEAGLPLAATTTAPGSSTTSPIAPTTTGPAVVVVHVAGAVAHPGVYELPGDARVHVAVEAAGGALPEAAPGALNLAAALTDGARIYVPTVGEEVAPINSSAPAAAAPSGPVDLNQATVAELDDLPGIGPATAQAIVDHRATNGPFASVDDLEAVRGIGPAKLAAVRELVRV